MSGLASSTVSVVIPVRNTVGRIPGLLEALQRQRPAGARTEAIVVDDGSSDGSAEAAARAGARVVSLSDSPGNPAAARNRGAQESRGDPIVFLDADCLPAELWLQRILDAHVREDALCVGGSFGLPDGAPWSARSDYYSGWYHVHPGRPAGWVLHHPPGNLSVRREPFLRGSGFNERHPIAYAHEELRWQAELARRGRRLYFEPTARVDHYNRVGFANLLRRSYRWGYSAIESKSEVDLTRLSRLYRSPVLATLLALPSAPAQALWILGCWVRAGKMEPLLHSPNLVAASIAYGAGMALGGASWLRRSRLSGVPEARPRWH